MINPEVEPIHSDDPLLTLDNLIITPHTAGSSPVSRFEGSIKQAENVISILTGGRPHGLTNPEVIKTITINKLNGDKRWEGFKEFKLPNKLLTSISFVESINRKGLYEQPH